MKREGIYFISDAHLGYQSPMRSRNEGILLDFFKSISGRAEKLFIVGDLFDFWIEYKWAIRPDYFSVLHALKNLIESGTEVHYCLGNHDFAIGDFIEKTIGIAVHGDGYQGYEQGKKILVFHGEGLRKGDWSNRLLRRILRCPSLQAGYRLLHPGLGIPLAEFLSRMSRRHFPPRRMKEILEEYRQIARGYLGADNEIVITGHTHHPEICYFNDGIFCNTGNWMGDYSYALLADGEVSLWRYRRGNSPDQIKPVETSEESLQSGR